jgi:hypothetical protein
VSVFFIELKAERPCQGCEKMIAAGEKAIKTKTSKFSCSQTETYTVYYHEACWIKKRRR